MGLILGNAATVGGRASGTENPTDSDSNLATAITQNFGSAGVKICNNENVFSLSANAFRGALSNAFLGAQIVAQK